MLIGKNGAQFGRHGETPRLSLSHIEAFILQLLAESQRKLYGLEMIGVSGGALKRGTIYVVLKRMQEKGLIDSETEPRPANEAGIPRRLYWATELGEKLLDAYGVHQEAQRQLKPSYSPGGG